MSLIEESQGSGGASDHESRRRYYRLSGTGKTLLRDEVSRLESVVRLARQKKLLPKGVG